VSGPVPFAVTAKKCDAQSVSPTWFALSLIESERSASPRVSERTEICPVLSLNETVD